MHEPDTEEGLDKYMTLFYFSRARLAFKLLPLLRESPIGGRVVFVANPKTQGKMNLDDLELRKNFSIRLALSHYGGLQSWFLEELSRRNPAKVVGCHYYPGTVMTDLAWHSDIPRWTMFLWSWIVGPIMRIWSVPFDECGQRILFMASPRFAACPDTGEPFPSSSADGVDKAEGRNGVLGSGAYDVNWDDSIIPPTKEMKQLREERPGEKMWDHTMAAWEAIESGKVWRG